MRTENWRRVPGFPGIEASDAGRIRRGGRILRPWRVRACRRIYLKVELWPIGAPVRRRYVHELVLAAHVGPRPDGHEARHLDGDSMNCALENLAWGTKVENAADRARHSRDRGPGPVPVFWVEEFACGCLRQRDRKIRCLGYCEIHGERRVGLATTAAGDPPPRKRTLACRRKQD